MRNQVVMILGSVGLLSLSISCEVYPQQALSSPLEDGTVAQVVKVTDGDTVKLSQGNEMLRVRLSCVDAPEMAQDPYGELSKTRLAQLLPRGATVQMRKTDRDRYGRIIAELYRENHPINLQLIQEGMAVVYSQYLNGCTLNPNLYIEAETRAKAQQRGIWSQDTVTMPWDFRSGANITDTSSPSVTANNNCSPAYPDVCIPPAPPDLDCGDISHRRFRVLSPDPHGFDGDNDGIGCESG